MSRILFPSPRDQPSTSTSSTSSTSSQHPQKLRSSSRPSLGRHDSIVSLPSPCSSPDRARESELPFSLPLGPASPTTRDGSSDVEMEDTNPFLSRPVARPGRPDHPQSSPTQGVRRKVDKERIKVVKKADWVGAKGMGRGWDSPSNPFIAREGEERVRPRGGAKKPEKVTYVLYVLLPPPLLAQLTSSPVAGNASPTTCLSPPSSLPKTPRMPPSPPRLLVSSSPPRHPSRRPLLRTLLRRSWTRCARGVGRGTRSNMGCRRLCRRRGRRLRGGRGGMGLIREWRRRIRSGGCARRSEEVLGCTGGGLFSSVRRGE